LSRDKTPDYLIIGHILKDIIPGGAILGGTVSYAGLTADKLGQFTVAVTSYGPDIPSLTALNNIKIKTVPAPQSTTFENVYENGVRHQKWFTDSTALSADQIPKDWRNTPIVHLAPMAQEISPEMCGYFRNNLVCVTMQGWLRGRDKQHNVIYQTHPNLEKWLPHIDILVLSLADVRGNEDALNHFLNTVQLGVETLGPEGCRVFHRGTVTHVPVQPVKEVDPTGAGDVFAAAFFIRYRQTRDVIEAAQFANACASLSVKGVGVECVPSLDEAETHMRELYGT
jgi:sugar/nucleoside kinase (ribokinase family)